MASSRSGAGGKIVANRRRQRLDATPYDRPPQPVPPIAVVNKTNWFTGLIIPSARALASGAGKIVSTIFSESESSSSEDENYDSEDDIGNGGFSNHTDGINVLNEHNITSKVEHLQQSLLGVRRTETKRVIEQLIMQETFSRDECDRLVKVINSRVVDSSTEAGEKRLLAGSCRMTEDHGDIYNKAVLEAKKWFQEKKVGSSSGAELAHQTSNVENEGGSPVDVARSYMKDRPPWASPAENPELRTPLTTTLKLFKEGSSYSVDHDSLSLSKKRSSLSSGSWNIQEELRRVRSKATEDMLRTPATKIDPSWFSIAPSRQDSAGTGKVSSIIAVKTTEPNCVKNSKPIGGLVDAGVSSDPALAALESRKDAKPSDAPSSRISNSVSGKNKNSEAVQLEEHQSGPNHPEEHHTDSHASKNNGAGSVEITECGGKKNLNGPLSSHESFSAGVTKGNAYENYEEENNQNVKILSDKLVKTTNAAGNREFLSEAYMEIPVATETDVTSSGSKNLVGQKEELSTKGTSTDTVAGKQQAKRTSKISRRRK